MTTLLTISLAQVVRSLETRFSVVIEDMVAKRVFVVASLYSLSLLLSVVQAQLSTVNITEVMESLSRRFQEIRNDGLGIDRLEVPMISLHAACVLFYNCDTY